VTALLLTGATGLVGTRILPRLVDAGFDTRALVRKEIGLPEGATGVHGDLADSASLMRAVEGVDTVVHLAALFRTEDEAAIWRSNVDGTRNLIEAVREKAPHARFVMASTGNVYAADGSRPSREDDPATATAAYPASKIAAEQLLRDSGLKWAILRLPFVYGDDDGHLATIPVHAPRFGLHPAHMFSVAHHRDIAVAVRLALTGAMTGRIVNVTDDADATVLEMAALAGNPIEGSAKPLTNRGRAAWTDRSPANWASGRRFRPSATQRQRASSDR
jgi:UDP-glucose 4-epimerase